MQRPTTSRTACSLPLGLTSGVPFKATVRRIQAALPIPAKASASLTGRVPAYLLTDNGKTVTMEHVAGVPVRNPAAVAFPRHYG